jgi:hypothetical protein
MSKKEYETNTSQWSLIVQRVTASSVDIWVGTLFPTLKMPEHARVQLVFPDGKIQTRQIGKKDWKRPFREMKQRFYAVCSFNNLKPATRYTGTFYDRQLLSTGK